MRPVVVWTGAIICVAIAWVAFDVLDFGPGMPSIRLRLLLSGIVFIGPAIYVRRHWGALALAGLVAVAVTALATALGSTLAEDMDLFQYSRGVVAASVMLTPSLGVVALTLHRLAKGSPAPMLQRDFPIGLAVYALAQLLGFALAVAVIMATTPFVTP